MMMKRLLGWILPLTTIVVIIAVSLLVLYPWMQDAFEGRDTIPVKEQTLQQLMTKLATLGRQDSRQLRDYLLTLEVVLPSEPQPALTLAELESLLSANGLVLNSTQFTGEEEQTVRAELSLSGEYDQLVALMHQLEQAAPLLHVRQFQLGIERGVEIEAAGTLNQVIHIGAPYESLPGDLGAVEEPVDELSRDELELLQKAQALETVLQPVGEEEVEVVEKGKVNPFE